MDVTEVEIDVRLLADA